MGSIIPGNLSEIGKAVGWVDVQNGINVVEMRDGSVLVHMEEVMHAKVLLFKFPPGECAPAQMCTSPTEEPSNTCVGQEMPGSYMECPSRTIVQCPSGQSCVQVDARVVNCTNATTHAF